MSTSPLKLVTPYKIGASVFGIHVKLKSGTVLHRQPHPAPTAAELSEIAKRFEVDVSELHQFRLARGWNYQVRIDATGEEVEVSHGDIWPATKDGWDTNWSRSQHEE